MPSKKKSGFTKIETVCGTEFYTILSGAASGQLSLSPQNITRATTISDVFQFFRFKRIEVQWLGGTLSVALGFTPNSDSPPATIQNCLQLEPSNISWGLATVPSKLVIDRSILIGQGMNKWWKTRDSTNIQPIDELQGLICAVASTSTTFNIVFKWEMELCGWAPTGSTPLPSMTILKQFASLSDEDKKRLLVELVGSGVVSSAPSVKALGVPYSHVE